VFEQVLKSFTTHFRNTGFAPILSVIENDRLHL